MKENRVKEVGVQIKLNFFRQFPKGNQVAASKTEKMVVFPIYRCYNKKQKFMDKHTSCHRVGGRNA